MTSPETPPRKSPILPHLLAKGVSTAILIAMLIPLLGVVALFAPGPLNEEGTLIITHGERTTDIGTRLEEKKAVYLAPLFHAAARLVANGSLKAGEYAIPAHASALDIAIMMHEGRSVLRLFTVAEGLTSAEVAHMLENDPALTGALSAPPAEGSLLPETYRYSYGDDRAHLIARMQKAMRDKRYEIWAGRAGDLPLKSPEEMATLASIVEKETGKTEERARIAGVFYNRLRLNMRLQSDPTVIYALVKAGRANGADTLPRSLTHDDLSFASPFNTYANDGLPPQPICNPGRASLEATAHPEHNNFLYFVANGSGGHAFATDLATQNENINRWHQAIENAASPK